MTLKKSITLLVGLFFLFCFSIIPFNSPLSKEAIQMVGIFIGAIILWVGVGIGWPSVLVLFALTQLPSVSMNQVIGASLGNNTIAFLIFSCILTFALSETGFLKRVAVWFVNSNFAQKNCWAFAAMYFLSILVIGSFIAPTVLFVLFMALHEEICNALKLEKGTDFARMLMIGTAIMTSISCAMTPIAHTFPLMALGYFEAEFGYSISWGWYMLIGIPAGLVIAMISFYMLYRRFSKKNNGAEIKKVHIIENSISKEEKVSVIVFGFVVLMWLSMGIVPKAVPWINSLTTTGPAIIGVIVLSALGILNFNKAIKEGVPWTAIVLCASTLAVGKWLTSSDFGITTVIGSIIAPSISNSSVIIAILLVTAFAIIMTNFTSNIVTTTVAYNLLTPIITATGVMNPVLSTILIGIGASMAYATPPSIAHVALAAGSGYCDSKDMLISGGATAIVSIICVTIFAILFKGVFMYG